MCSIFEKAGFKIVCHDFKGQMKSAKPVPESGIYSFKEHAEEAKELFDFLGLKKVNIAGISYGGEVGRSFAFSRVCSNPNDYWFYLRIRWGL